jgi:Smg protein
MALPSIRIFTEEESEVMSGSCRETLLHLERLGIVDPICREIVIDYLMALDSYQVGLDDLKWAVAMAFMTDQSAEDAFWEEVDPDSASEGEAHWLFQDDTLNIH